MKNKSSQPKISVVMATYNAREYLREAIESVLDQTFGDFEFLIIDDGSTDDTVKIIKSYKDPRIVLHQRQHKGLIDTLNYGIRIAKGEYIARMDADDISDLQRLGLQVDFLDTHPDYTVVGTTMQVIDTKGRTLKISALPLLDEDIRLSLLVGGFLAHGSVMMRKAAVRNTGGYDPKFIHAEDYDLWTRLSRTHKIANLPQALFKWRRNPKGVSSTKAGIQRQTAEKIRAREWEFSVKTNVFSKFNLWSFYRAHLYKNYQEDPFLKLRKETLATIYLELGKKLLAFNKRIEAVKFILASLTLYPTRRRSYFYLLMVFLPVAVQTRVKFLLETASAKNLS